MKVTDSKLIDSSVWIAYLVNSSFSEIFESDEMLFLSVLSLFEIRKIFTKQKIAPEQITKSIEAIKKRSFLINVDVNISELAAEISSRNKLPAFDALIYASTLKNNAELVTLDNDFRNLERVRILN